MDKILKNEEVEEKWFSLSIGEQISNIGSEVLRADNFGNIKALLQCFFVIQQN